MIRPDIAFPVNKLSQFLQTPTVAHWSDIAFPVNKLSQFLQTPTVAHWSACKSILGYTKGTLSYGLVFKPTTHLHLEGFWDADGASSLDDQKSVIGICVFLRGYLITRSSRKQRVVACSSTEAGYRALASAATKLVWIQNLLAEIGVCLPSPTPVIWSDNLGAQALACSPVCWVGLFPLCGGKPKAQFLRPLKP